MDYTIIGDLHAQENTLPKDRDLFDIVELLEKPCIWLGDLLHTKSIIKGPCLNALISYFQKSKLTHIVLVGNHDYFNSDSKEHSLEALKLLDNVVVVDEPTVTNNLLLIPYFRDQSELRRILTKFADPTKTLIGHLELKDFDFGNGHICTEGLSLEELSGFRRVISGHFHKYQNKGNLTYLGTPFSHSFGEANQTKYLAYYNSETDELKLAETDFPAHISVEVNCDEPYQLHSIKALCHKKNYNRIILIGKQSNIDSFPKDEFSELGIKWITRPTDHADNSVVIEDTTSNENQFTKWAKEIKKMDEKTIELGLAIMKGLA